MKKFSIILLAAVLALSLASCGGEPAGSTDTTTEASVPTSDETTEAPADTTEAEVETTEKIPETTAAAGISELELELDCGVTVVVGSEATAALAAIEGVLGEHIDFMEAPSCVHDGNDKVYSFDGFTVTSSPDANGAEFISDLTFTSDAVGLDSGLMIGSSSDDVTAEFGEDFEEKFGVRKYNLGAITVTVTFDGDMVSAMSVSCAK